MLHLPSSRSFEGMNRSLRSAAAASPRSIYAGGDPWHHGESIPPPVSPVPFSDATCPNNDGRSWRNRSCRSRRRSRRSPRSSVSARTTSRRSAECCRCAARPSAGPSGVPWARRVRRGPRERVLLVGKASELLVCHFYRGNWLCKVHQQRPSVCIVRTPHMAAAAGGRR